MCEFLSGEEMGEHEEYACKNGFNAGLGIFVLAFSTLLVLIHFFFQPLTPNFLKFLPFRYVNLVVYIIFSLFFSYGILCVVKSVKKERDQRKNVPENIEEHREKCFRKGIIVGFVFSPLVICVVLLSFIVFSWAISLVLYTPLIGYKVKPIFIVALIAIFFSVLVLIRLFFEKIFHPYL